MSFARGNQKFQIQGVEINRKSRTCLRIHDNRRFSITPQQLNILELLLENIGRVVTYQQFKEKIWEGVSVEFRPILRHAVNHLRIIFGKEVIETVTDTGYRFVEAGKNSIIEKLSEKTLPAFDLSRLFGGHAYFAVAACLLYTSVCVVSLYLETAYEFQKYKSGVFKLTAPVFLLAMFFSLLSLWLIHFLYVKKNSAKGLAVGILVIVVGSLIVVLVGALVLPTHSITKTTDLQSQTQTAQLAHFKNVFVYLQLFYLPAITVPYGLIISWKNKINSSQGEEVKKILHGKPAQISLPSRLNLSPLWMIVILLVIFIFSVATTHLFLDRIESGENQDFFSKLIWGRNILYYSIGIMGIWWYYEKRREIEAFCLQPVGE